jgi:hypothetical protein
MPTRNFNTPNYSTYDVLAIYWQTEENANPSVEEITQFDATLFADNDATLVRIMTEVGIPTDKSTKSTVLLLSRTGTGGLGQRISDACTFFKSTHVLEG